MGGPAAGSLSMGSYTQIAEAGSRHRARMSKANGPRRRASEGERRAAAPYLCPGCGDESSAPSVCDGCGLPFVLERSSVAVRPAEAGLRSGAGEVRAALVAMAALTPVAIGLVWLALQRFEMTDRFSFVSWPLLLALVVAALAVTLGGVIAALVARRGPALAALVRRANRGGHVGTLRVHDDGGRRRVYLSCDGGARIRVPVHALRVDDGARVRLSDGDRVELFGAVDDAPIDDDYRGLEREATFSDETIRVRRARGSSSW